MNRLLSPKYVSNSLRIKTKAISLKAKYKDKPYDVYKTHVKNVSLGEFSTNYLDHYRAFGYFNLENAQSYYNGKSSLIHDIILAIVTYNDMLERNDFDNDQLISLASSITKRAIYVDGLPQLMVDENFKKFNLKGKVYSGIIQAKAASFFIRVYRATGDDKHLKWAIGLLSACLRGKKDGGICIQNEYVKSWSEEYNTKTPSMVLNGFVFVVIALAEVVSFTDNYDIKKGYQDSMETLLEWLPFFKQENDMLYSMYHWDLCNVHYMGVMDYQFDHLSQLVDIPEILGCRDFIRANYNQDLFSSMISR